VNCTTTGPVDLSGKLLEFWPKLSVHIPLYRTEVWNEETQRVWGLRSVHFSVLVKYFLLRKAEKYKWKLYKKRTLSYRVVNILFFNAMIVPFFFAICDTYYSQVVRKEKRNSNDRGKNQYSFIVSWFLSLSLKFGQFEHHRTPQPLL